MRRTPLNLVLLAAVALAATLAWWSRPPASKDAPAWVGSTPASVQRISAWRDGETRFVLQREAAGWRLLQPLRRRADRDRVGHLLGLLKARPAEVYRSDDVDIAGAGLAPAAWVLEFDNTRIEFGRREPLGDRRYLRHGERVALLPDLWQPLLEAGTPALAERSLWPFEAGLQRIETPLVVAVREADGWRAAGGDAEQAAGFASAWRDASALTIEPLAATPDIGRVTLTAAGGEGIEYRLQEHEAGLALGSPEGGYQLVVDGSVADRLLRLAETGTAANPLR